MKTQPLSKASYNSLEEICSMCSSLQATIEQYSHVSEFIPAPLKDNISKFYQKAIDILDNTDN